VGTRYFVLRVDPYVFNGIRFLASLGAGLPMFLHARPWRWPRNDKLLLLACAALAVPGYNIPVALGARSVPAGELGLLIATEPVMIAALTLLLHRRTVQRRLVIGSLIAFLGVALTSGVLSAAQNFKLVGALQVLAGAFSWSCYTVLAAPSISGTVPSRLPVPLLSSARWCYSLCRGPCSTRTHGPNVSTFW
jgi:drug/metabolite transporter (DMT)-like permease